MHGNDIIMRAWRPSAPRRRSWRIARGTLTQARQHVWAKPRSERHTIEGHGAIYLYIVVLQHLGDQRLQLGKLGSLALECFGQGTYLRVVSILHFLHFTSASGVVFSHLFESVAEVARDVSHAARGTSSGYIVCFI